MISNLFTKENNSTVIGSHSYLNDKNQKMYKLLKLHALSFKVTPYLTGEIDSLKIKKYISKRKY